MYDQSFLMQFGANSTNKMRAVIAQVQPLYYWPSLTVRVRIDVVAEGSITQSIISNQNGLKDFLPLKSISKCLLLFDVCEKILERQLGAKLQMHP